MENIQNLSIDIMNNKVNDYIYTKQYDNGRKIIFTILEENVEKDIMNIDGLTATFKVMKPTGYKDIKCTIRNNKVEVILDEHATWAYGKLPYEITFVDGDTKITTVTGYMIVEKSVVQSNAVESPEETALLQQISNAVTSATQASNLAKKEADRIEIYVNEINDKVDGIKRITDAEINSICIWN